MRSALRAVLSLAFALACAACDGASEPGGSDAGAAPGGGACDYPAGPYGLNLGQRFPDFSFTDCDGNAFSFSRDAFCDAALTLVVVGSGWCVPCREEAARAEADLYVPFRDRGLRIVEILFEDDRSARATKLFCREWREQYGLTFDVLIDPLFDTMPWFNLEGPPLNVLVDREGVVRYRRTASAAEDLHDRIDELLPPR
jgi:hypothetical protein